MDLRDVPVCTAALMGRGALLQSPSSTSFGGPISLLILCPPNLPVPSSFNPLDVALNLLPMVQESSLSAAPICVSGVKNPEPFLLNRGGSASEDRAGRVERHWSCPSATLGAWRSPPCPPCLSAGGPSKRRRDGSRELERSGSGPSLRHGLSNLALSSEEPAKPPLSLAEKIWFIRCSELN